MSRAEPADDFYNWLYPGGDRCRSDRRAGAPATSDRSGSTWRCRIARIDCDDGSSVEEREFFAAVQDFKSASGRTLPTWTEILEVLDGLGYQRASRGGSPPPASAIS